MTIQKTINNYLDAVEKKFGADARKKTVVKHRGGNTFALKRANALHAQSVDLGNLSLMTRQLQTNS
ncbi:MAG: hypothetical protein R8K50_07585 [Mariprofundus sp.]